MIIYRFERQGIGPYVNRDTGVLSTYKYRRVGRKTQKKAQRFFDNQFLSTKINRQEAYFLAHQSKEYMYGCKSKEQLRAYFSGDFKQLFMRGYRIKRYRCPDNEVIDMVSEVAFPVKYHKFQSLKKVQRAAKAT